MKSFEIETDIRALAVQLVVLMSLSFSVIYMYIMRVYLKNMIGGSESHCLDEGVAWWVAARQGVIVQRLLLLVGHRWVSSKDVMFHPAFVCLSVC